MTHRRHAFLYFCVAQLNALVTGAFQVAYPDRSLEMFLVAFLGSTGLPLLYGGLHLRLAARTRA